MVQSLSADELRRSALAVALCLLAFLFAVEAKLALYGPANATLTSIQCAKARPADAHDPLGAVETAHPSSPLSFVVLLAVFAVAALAKGDSWIAMENMRASRSAANAVFRSPALYHRPPPVR